MTEATGDSKAPEGASNTQTPDPEPEDKGKTFTQDELNEIISKEKAKLKASYEQKQKEQAKKDAEAKELERLEGEAKLKKQFEIRERELMEAKEKAEHELAVSNVKAELSRLGYSSVSDIAPSLIGQDEEETKGNVAKFDQMVQALVSEQVSKNMNRGAPPDPEAGSATPDAEIQAMRRAVGL